MCRGEANAPAGFCTAGSEERLLGTELYPRLAGKESTVCCMRTCIGILLSLNEAPVENKRGKSWEG